MNALEGRLICTVKLPVPYKETLGKSGTRAFIAHGDVLVELDKIEVRDPRPELGRVDLLVDRSKTYGGCPVTAGERQLRARNFQTVDVLWALAVLGSERQRERGSVGRLVCPVVRREVDDARRGESGARSREECSREAHDVVS